MRQLSHLDGVLNGFPPWFERKAGISFVDGNSVEINFRTEPTVQFNLAPAKVAAFFQRAEIQKHEIHRFLHFEDKRRRNEDPYDEGLNHAYVYRVVRIGFGQY